MESNVCESFAPFKKSIMKNLGKYSGEWYFLNITPISTFSEICKIAYDIQYSLPITIHYGKLIHNINCKVQNHKLPNLLTKVINALESKSYKIAIYDNKNPQLFLGQPLIICINPKISFINYPDHPHLNSPIFGKKEYFPTSLCYTDAPNMIGQKFGNRINDSIFFTLEWLFRHQIWEKHRDSFGKGLWIGQSAKSDITSEAHFNILNPDNRCHCGKNKKYFECCMKKDYSLIYRDSLFNERYNLNLNLNINKLKNIWTIEILLNENSFLNKLESKFNELYSID